jgi:NitT/TauT family transport system substrate-binding protein
VDAATVVGSAIAVLQQRYPDLRLLADTRTPEGTQAAFGSSRFPSAALVAQAKWLKANGDTARRLVRATSKAMRWIAGHSAEEARALMPESLRMPDAASDLDAIRISQRNLSEDGEMPADGPATVRRVLAASNPKVRTASIDLSKTYTNEFLNKQ